MANDPVNNIDPDGGKDRNWLQRAWARIGEFTGLWGKGPTCPNHKGRKAEKHKMPEIQRLTIAIQEVQANTTGTQTATVTSNGGQRTTVTFDDGVARLGQLFMNGIVTTPLTTVVSLPTDFLPLFNGIVTTQMGLSTMPLSNNVLSATFSPSFLPQAAQNVLGDYYISIGNHPAQTRPAPALRVTVVSINHRNTKNVLVHRNWIGIVKTIEVGGKFYRGNRSAFIKRVTDFTNNTTLQGINNQGVNVTVR
jgi:hypothetical protein